MVTIGAVSISRSTLIGLGVVGAAAIGYCVYFDHKRRSAPDFKQKLKSKRAAQREAASSKRTAAGRGTVSAAPPDFNDPQAMQAFFLQEVQLGEELMAEGDFEGATEHLATAVMLCGSPAQLLQILQQTLPPNVYQMLVQKLPIRRVGPPGPGGAGGDGPTVAVLEEPDVE